MNIVPEYIKPLRLLPLFANRLSWPVAALVLVLALPAAGQDAASQIKREVETLQQSLKDAPVASPDFPNANATFAGSLQSVIEAQSAGRLYWGLAQLEQTMGYLYAVRTVIGKQEAVKGGLPAYMTEWDKASLRVSELNRQSQARNWRNGPAALQALSETARARTIPMLEGGRQFAVSTDPKDGLFPLGQAQGDAEFANFCASLHLSRKGAPFPLRSLLPELMSLQEKVNVAYQPPRSITLHSRFIGLNSSIKLAQDLDASKSYAGALYQYLYATLNYGLLDASPPDAARQAVLKTALGEARKKVQASRRDDSVAQLLLEYAESKLAHADGSGPSADDWKSTQVIVEQVLPAYYAAAKPPAAMGRAPGKTVNLTLVRWPYT